MESFSPNIFVKDMKASIAFYTQLGFQLINTVPEGEKEELIWALMVCNNVHIMFQAAETLREDLPQISRQDGGSLLFYIKLKNIRSFFEKIRNRVPVVNGLEKTFYGATEFSIVDNNNYVLTFAEDEGE
ncbi:VOC family protein [Flavitalea flava]